VDTFIERVRRNRNPVALADQKARRNAGPQIHRIRKTRSERQQARKECRDLVRGRCLPSDE
jgi:hypothetical protein